MKFTPEEISQLLVVGIQDNSELSHIEELQPGGVILFARNAAPKSEMLRLTHRIEALCKTKPIICVDQEGGRVQRLQDGFTRIRPMRDVAQSGARAVSIAAMSIAAELRSVGINCNLAPVCDVPIHPEDTVIGNRAFSSDPIEASLMAAEYIRAAQPTVMCVAKHFPGHGGVGVDSHHALPTYASTQEELESIHLTPFRAAIGAGVAGVMMGHIAIPNLDKSGTPASLSQPITTGLLREKLNFRGVVFTDDLEMNALPQDNAGHVAVRAVNAGCDLLLFCHSAEKAAQGREALLQAVESGALDAARVEDALSRVRWAKQKFGVVR